MTGTRTGGRSLGLSFAVCYDTQCGVMDSLRHSWMITQPVVLSLLGLIIVLVLIAALCFVALVLPYLFLAAPLGMGVAGAAYCMIADQTIEGAPA